MDALTEHEMEVIVQRLEILVTALEHDLSTPTLYAFVLLAQECAGMKKGRYTLAHIRRCLALVHHMRPIRDRLVSAGGRWTPLHEVGEVLHAEATRLSSLYGVARPACSKQRRELQQAFRAAFTQETGKGYQKYGLALTAKERATITGFWDNALRTALVRFQAHGEVEALDQVMACLPVWADRHHERWSRQGWREPSAHEVTTLFTDYLMVCEACLGTVAEIASAAVAHAPVVDRTQVTQDVSQQYPSRSVPSASSSVPSRSRRTPQKRSTPSCGKRKPSCNRISKGCCAHKRPRLRATSRKAPMPGTSSRRL